MCVKRSAARECSSAIRADVTSDRYVSQISLGRRAYKPVPTDTNMAVVVSTKFAECRPQLPTVTRKFYRVSLVQVSMSVVHDSSDFANWGKNRQFHLKPYCW